LSWCGRRAYSEPGYPEGDARFNLMALAARPRRFLPREGENTSGNLPEVLPSTHKGICKIPIWEKYIIPKIAIWQKLVNRPRP